MDAGSAAEPPTPADVVQAAPGATGPGDPGLRRLDPRQVRALRECWWIVLAVFALVLLGAWGIGLFLAWFGGAAAWLVLGGVSMVLTLTTLGALTLPQLSWEHTSYRVGAIGLEIQRGIVWRSVVFVPRARIQHTDVTQGPIGRRHGVATLRVHTAGSEYSTIELDGLDRAVALQVRDDLLADSGTADGA